MIWRTLLLTVIASGFLSGCGTTYSLPTVDESSAQKAKVMFSEAQKVSRPTQSSDSVAASRFRRVSARIEPVAEAFCRREMSERVEFECDVTIGIDAQMKERNAYFTYLDAARKEQPAILVTIPLLRDVQNDDELAFILGHEFGHLIGRHIQKQEQQAVVGALLLGTLAAAASANNPYADPNLVSDNIELGYAIGERAFSQEYELESDTLGAAIARAAGYDPVRGARFFARGEAARVESGRLSFWGTHPPDEKRLATVIATVEQLESSGGISRK